MKSSIKYSVPEYKKSDKKLSLFYSKFLNTYLYLYSTDPMILPSLA